MPGGLKPLKNEACLDKGRFGGLEKLICLWLHTNYIGMKVNILLKYFSELTLYSRV